MQTRSDAFSSVFDSIKIEAQAESDPPAADEMLAFGEYHGEPAAHAPGRGAASGFTLLDDADGRFAIDRDTGIITLLHGHLLEVEPGAEHPVHIRVIEPSGASYELKFRLRMTGLIPQIAGAEEFDSLAGLGSASAAALAPAPRITITPPAAAPAQPSPWARLAALDAEQAPFGAVCTAPTPCIDAGTGDLTLSTAPPRAASAAARWII
jgi:hypothetical protein